MSIAAGEPVTAETKSAAVPRWNIEPLWAGCCGLAAALILVAAFMPLWRLELKAPQYPKGLFISAYGYDMTGDLREINQLNHYVGVKPIEPDTVLELKLFPFGIAGVVLALAGGALFRDRRIRWAVIAVAWTLPIFTLVDLQFWLYRYGHDLNPDAALRLEPFTPKVIGSTKVMNFHSETMVTFWFGLMVLAALLVSVGPRAVRWLRDSWKNTGEPGAVAKTAAIVLAVIGAGMALRPCSPAEAAGMSISDALARAAPGDTVTIPAGTYHEHLVITRPVTLEGVGWPTIDGDRHGDVIVIAAEDVTLRGFVIQGSGREVSSEPAGIRVKANRATIDGNRIRDMLYVIVLEESDGHTVTGNEISSIREFPPERRGHGLLLHNTNHNRFEGNRIEYTKDGIFFGFTDDNDVIGNTITHVRYGFHTMYASNVRVRNNVLTHNVAGGALMYSKRIEFTGNELAYNQSEASGYGLLFKDVDDIDLVGNFIHHNTLGLTMDGAPLTPGHHVTVRDNLLAFNRTAVEMFTTTDVTYTGNSFVGNLNQVSAPAGDLEFKNRWSLDGRGNYWDDYQGYDADGDGVGDITYRYEGAYDALVEREPGLRAYDYTPARMALELGARWFPAYRPEPRAVDEHPLMSPTKQMPHETRARDVASGLALVTLLTAVPLALAWSSSRWLRQRWATC